MFTEQNSIDYICNGMYSDRYLAYTHIILDKDNRNPIVTQQYFSRQSGMLCGIDHCIKLIKAYTKKIGVCDLKIYSLKDGDVFYPNTNIMIIEGPYRQFVILETVILGLLARQSTIATNMNNIIQSAPEKDVMLCSARFDIPLAQNNDGYAAYIGGCRKFSTNMNIKSITNDDIEVVGTIPHSLISAYNGDTVKAMLAFDSYIPKDVPRIALVDFENNCPKTAVEVAKAMNGRLYGVRIDTSPNMVDKSIIKMMSKIRKVKEIAQNIDIEQNLNGVNGMLISNVRTALDLNGFEHVKIYISSGMTPKKLKLLQWADYDGVGVGEYIVHNNPITFTADAVRTNGKNCAKSGRNFKLNSKLNKIII